MRYKSIEQLPKSVREELPSGAQEIYLRVYNSAWDNYENAKNYTGEESREETASQVAWEAVKKQYEKANEDARWEEKYSPTKLNRRE